jgi:hypothetical protein
VPRTDRFVLAVSAMVLLLIALAVGSVALAQCREPPVLPDTSPTGVVYHYLAALDQENYDAAYSYLSSSTRAWISLDEFRRRSPRPLGSPPGRTTSVSLSNERITGERARVTIAVTTFYPSGPFGGNEYTRSDELDLVREGGAWKIDVPRDAYHRLYPRDY